MAQLEVAALSLSSSLAETVARRPTETRRHLATAALGLLQLSQLQSRGQSLREFRAQPPAPVSKTCAGCPESRSDSGTRTNRVCLCIARSYRKPLFR